MEFCPNCGSRLIYKNQSNLLSLFCPKCAHKSEPPKMRFFTNRNNHGVNNSGLIVIDRKSQRLRAHPTVNISCPRCKGKTAETWSMTIGSEGYSEATFFRCTSCNYTWRDTD